MAIAFEVKPRLVRGLDYYTRTTFEIVHGSLGAQNSVLGGGRYDGLAGSSRIESAGSGNRFLHRRRPARDERRRASSAQRTPLQLLIAPMGEAALRHSALLARDIRAKGAVVEIAPDGKLKKSLELANKIGAQQTLIVGDNEIASGAYALKNMTSGEQTSVSREDLLNRF